MMSPDEMDRKIAELCGELGWDDVDERIEKFNLLLQNFAQCIIQLRPVFVSDEQLKEEKVIGELLDKMVETGWIIRKRTPRDINDMGKGMGVKCMPTDKLSGVLICDVLGEVLKEGEEDGE